MSKLLMLIKTLCFRMLISNNMIKDRKAKKERKRRRTVIMPCQKSTKWLRMVNNIKTGMKMSTLIEVIQMYL